MATVKRSTSEGKTTAAAKPAAQKTEDEAKETAAAKKAREKAEAAEKARKAKIESGDLVVTKTHEFEASTRETKTYTQISGIVDAIKGSKEPVVFTEVVEKVGAKYPEDLQPAMHALEHLGLVKRFQATPVKDGEATGRKSAAYLWVG